MAAVGLEIGEERLCPGCTARSSGCPSPPPHEPRLRGLEAPLSGCRRSAPRPTVASKTATEPHLTFRPHSCNWRLTSDSELALASRRTRIVKSTSQPVRPRCERPGREPPPSVASRSGRDLLQAAVPSHTLGNQTHEEIHRPLPQSNTVTITCTGFGVACQ